MLNTPSNTPIGASIKNPKNAKKMGIIIAGGCPPPPIVKTTKITVIIIRKAKMLKDIIPSPSLPLVLYMMS